MLHKELASLAALLWVKLKDSSPPLRVTPSSFESLSSFFEVKHKKAAAPLPHKKSSALSQEPARKLFPTTTSSHPPKTKELEAALPPAALSDPEPTLPPLKGRDKKFERLLPITKELPYCKRGDPTQPSSILFERRSPHRQWGVVSFFPAHTKEQSLSLVQSIQTALTSKLSLSLHTLDKENEHFALRLQAASSTLSTLLIFAEPHAQAHMDTYFHSLVSLERPQAVPLPLHWLGKMGNMSLYFVPIALSMKEDLQAKRNLWLALQHLAKSPL